MHIDREPSRAPLARLSPYWAPLLIPFFVLAVYLPVVVVPFAFLDDYTLLANVHGLSVSEPSASWEWLAKSGRPLAWLFAHTYELVPDIDGLRWLRLAGLVGITLIGSCSITV